jgi:hypothetical protein
MEQGIAGKGVPWAAVHRRRSQEKSGIRVIKRGIGSRDDSCASIYLSMKSLAALHWSPAASTRGVRREGYARGRDGGGGAPAVDDEEARRRLDPGLRARGTDQVVGLLGRFISSGRNQTGPTSSITHP